MEVTSINIFGIHITEPFTWLTNWLIAGFSFYFGHLLYHDKEASEQKKYWSMFFLFIGAASMTGGTAHGFITYVGNNFHLAAWVLTGFAVFSAQLASLPLVQNKKLRQVMQVFIVAEVIAMTASVILFKNFDSVRINSAFALVGFVLVIQVVNFIKYRTRKSLLLAVGILSNVIPALIHAIKVSYNEWFNFNDLSHVVMIGCFYIIYYGAKQSDLNPKLQTG